ncbi:hypothetical protein LCGC14_0103050 [marine sediment metagenome]|uniref:Uncharacterized protein n=1 Tax=marine sediment metagenome TaxID=412755 RepID=A0A0F9VFQ2_9ZZZZ|nr:hypothetical protein [Candidatus Nealsonbacteria bacterium]
MNQLYFIRRNIDIKKVLTSLGLIVAVLVLLIAPPVQIARAATLLNMRDTLTTVKASTVTDHEIIFRTPTGADESTDTIIIDIGATDTSWNTSSLAIGDVDLAHSAGAQSDCDAPTFSNEETLAASATATDWQLDFDTTNDILTFTAPTDGVGAAAIATNACVQIQIGTNASGGSNQITNSTAGSKNIDILGTFNDTGTIVVTLIADDIVVTTATVVASLTFTVDDNDIFFGTLGAGAAKWADNTADGSTSSVVGHTMTVGTNSTSGYSVTYNGTALTSGSDKISDSGNTTITGDADGTPGSEEFAIGVTVSDNATIASGYEQASNNFKFVESTTATLVSETIQTAAETISVYYITNIAANTEAHIDYTSNITYIATGNF